MKKATLKVDLDALLYNYRHIKCTYNKDVIAVIKDNAYSMGLIEIAKFLQNEKNIIFAVSSMEEVILLRNNNISCPILYLNVFDKEDLEDIKKYNVTVIVQSKKQLRLIKNSQIDFHIKINSGMNRLGLYDYELNDVIKEINSFVTSSGFLSSILLALKSSIFDERFGFDAILIVGTGDSSWDSIPVVKRMICAPAAVSAIVDSMSPSVPKRRLRPFFDA